MTDQLKVGSSESVEFIEVVEPAERVIDVTAVEQAETAKPVESVEISSDSEEGGLQSAKFASVAGIPAVLAPELPAGTPVRLISPVVLAYVGDAVFEVFVRQHLVAALTRKPNELHRAATRYVSAAAQARLLARWQPLLTEDEADVVRRGRNAKSGQPPRNADAGDYRHATALECLVGYLYYQGERERLEQLMALAFDQDHKPEGSARPGRKDELT